MNNIKKSAAIALLIFAALALACGWGSKVEDSDAKTGNRSIAEASPSPSPDSTPADTSPVEIEAATLISEAKSSDLAKYTGRMMTVTDGKLWEIMYSHVKIGGKYGTYSDGYIICNGSFSDYTPYASKIADMERAGKSPGATIKGRFVSVKVDSGYTQVHLDPCVLSDLEK
jgi:hypothetical protein